MSSASSLYTPVRATRTEKKRIVNVGVPAALVEYCREHHVPHMLWLLLVDIVDATNRAGGKDVNQRALRHAPGIGGRQCEKFRAIARDLATLGLLTVDHAYQPGISSKRYSITSAAHTVIGAVVVGVSVDMAVLDVAIYEGWERINQRTIEQTEAALVKITVVGVPERKRSLKTRAAKEIRARKPWLSQTKIETKAERHVSAIRRAQRDTVGRVRIRSHRIYHALSSLPQWARREYVRRVERLLDLIESGEFYVRMAQQARMSKNSAKQSFNTLCLFGGADEYFGRNKLWYALQDLCPEITAEILRQRKLHGSTSEFARHCQCLESLLVLRGALHDLTADGVPCIVLHDGMLVPPHDANRAEAYLRAKSVAVFGRECAVKIE